MVKTLILMRHGQSPMGSPDKARVLSGQGRKDIQQQAEFLKDCGAMPDAILSSAAMRTTQSAQIIASEFFGIEPQLMDCLYDGSVQSYFNVLRSFSLPDTQNLMLVGHNPSIAGLVIELLTEDERMKLYQFPPGFMAILRCDIACWSELTAGTCALQDFIIPQ